MARNLIETRRKFLKKKYSWKLYNKWRKILLKITRTIKQKVNIIIKNSGYIQAQIVKHAISLKKKKKQKKERKENKWIKIYRIKIEDNGIPLRPSNKIERTLRLSSFRRIDFIVAWKGQSSRLNLSFRRSSHENWRECHEFTCSRCRETYLAACNAEI